MDILLIDSSPYTQKTLRYFLHPYSPKIHSVTSQNKKPEGLPDIIFLDSDHIHHPVLKQFEESPPPVVLISQDEKVLKQNAQIYPTQLKKPLNQKKLQEVIHYVLPKTKEMPFSSYLEFHTLSSSEEKRMEKPKEDLKTSAPLEKNPTIPLSPEESPISPEESSNELSENTVSLTPLSAQEKPPELEIKSSELEIKSPISIPKDLTLTDQKEITALHNTTSFLKKTSQKRSKNKTAPKTPSKNILSVDKTVIQSKEVSLSLEENQNLEDSDKTMIHPPEASPVQAKKIVVQPTSSISDQKNQVLEDPDKTQVEHVPIQAESVVIQTTKPLKESQSSEKADVDKTIILPQSEKQKSKTPKTSAPPPEENLAPSLQDISKVIQTSLENKWKAFQQKLEKELLSTISETAQKILKEELKKEETRFTKKIQQELESLKNTLKQTYEEVSWKVIPEMSRQIIQKEIQKLIESNKDKPS